MIGFELKINGEKMSASIAEGVLSLIITKVTNNHEDSINLDLTGMDTKDGKYVDWISKQLKEGDELTLQIKSIEKVSSPIKIRKINNQFDKEQKLKNYYSLKKSLENDGLI